MTSSLNRAPEPLETPRWELFYGNNHLCIEPPSYTRGGAVSFAKHLGKPLSDALWEDLIFRCTISGLRIYKPEDAQWCDGSHCWECVIELDSQGNVEDIRIALNKRRRCRST